MALNRMRIEMTSHMLKGYEPTPRQESGNEVCRAAAQVYRRILGYASRELVGEGFGRGKQVVLRILGDRDGLSLAGIADAGALDRGNVTRIVSSLEADGYVRRENDPSARHGYLVFLTEKGRRATLRVHEVLDVWNERLFEGLSDEELTRLASVLNALAARSDELWADSARRSGEASC